MPSFLRTFNTEDVYSKIISLCSLWQELLILFRNPKSLNVSDETDAMNKSIRTPQPIGKGIQEFLFVTPVVGHGRQWLTVEGVHILP
jgi:hypothetical protein